MALSWPTDFDRLRKLTFNSNTRTNVTVSQRTLDVLDIGEVQARCMNLKDSLKLNYV